MRHVRAHAHSATRITRGALHARGQMPRASAQRSAPRNTRNGVIQIASRDTIACHGTEDMTRAS
eukprot:10173420-Alexandrium_andersonii.AAC.1